MQRQQQKNTQPTFVGCVFCFLSNGLLETH
jgi:hypothetical protein